MANWPPWHRPRQYPGGFSFSYSRSLAWSTYSLYSMVEYVHLQEYSITSSSSLSWSWSSSVVTSNRRWKLTSGMTGDLWIWVEVSWSIYLALPQQAYTTITVFAPVFAPASQSPGLPARPLASYATATLRGNDQGLMGMPSMVYIDHLLLWFCI